MLLRAEFVALALRLQEMADGKVDTSEAGARNSKRDLAQLQTIHDSAAALGANCSMAEAVKQLAASETGKTPSSEGNGSTHVSPGSGIEIQATAHGTGKASVLADESANPRTNPVNRETSVHLIESAATLETIVLQEAKADYEIKLIAPGKGSSAFYPAEVLKRDGPGIFKEGTQVFLNHATKAEEAARPEGDVKNLAGVLTTAAVYHESHAKGPGLYARMKVFADHAQIVEEKAAHVGMSIRASGLAESGQSRDGLPVLKQLTAAASVDVVTRAGAGGMILTESAHTDTAVVRENRITEIQTQEAAMDAAELKSLKESLATQSAVNAKLLERALRGDAREEASKILAPLSLAEASKARVIDTVLMQELPLKDGALDPVKFAEAVNAEAKREGAYVAGLVGSGKVIGMGPAPVVDPATATKIAEASKATYKKALDVFSEFGLSEAAAKSIASGYGEAA